MPLVNTLKTHAVKALIVTTISLSTLACANTALDNTQQQATNQPVDLTMASELKVATWNVEHLAYPSDIGCRPRNKGELADMQDYVKRVNADIFALQEVGSEEAVRQLFPADQWQIVMSPRNDSEFYTCRRSGNTSTQQKIAFAVKHAIEINSVNGISELALNRPGLRYGLEVNVASPLGPIAILNVHMKSGCFVDNYSRADSDACQTFAKQAPILDAWIEAKEKEKQAYMVLGDFNHRLTARYNHLTRQLFDNTDGSASSLVNTSSNMIGCHPYYPAPIDIIFVGQMPENIEMSLLTSKAHNFENMEPKEMLSDHCAVSLSIPMSATSI